MLVAQGPPTEDLLARTFTFGYKADETSCFSSGSPERIMHHAHTLVAELYTREIYGGLERPISFSSAMDWGNHCQGGPRILGNENISQGRTLALDIYFNLRYYFLGNATS